MKRVLAAAIKYATNHIPSYMVRRAWYRGIPGWRIGPNVAIFMGSMCRSLEGITF